MIIYVTLFIGIGNHIEQHGLVVSVYFLIPYNDEDCNSQLYTLFIALMILLPQSHVYS